MKNTTEEAIELKRLADVATQKRLAYQKINAELFGDNNETSGLITPEYSKAKAEFIEAVHNYNAYLYSLSKKSSP